jgi:hypothetical protein
MGNDIALWDGFEELVVTSHLQPITMKRRLKLFSQLERPTVDVP